MSRISTYEVVPVPKLADKLIGTSVGGEIEDVTYNFTLQELLNLFIPFIPANNLQGVLDFGNTATQDINLFGTITTTNLDVTNTSNLFITYLNDEVHIVGSLFDSNNLVGTAGQVLTSTGSGVEWYTLPPIFTPNLQQVLTEGNTANVDIILTSDLSALDVSSDTATFSVDITIDGTLTDGTASVGTAGKVLSSTGIGVQWIDLPIYSATSPLFFNSITGVFSIQVANATQNGYLSSADWITFDGKQNAGNYITALTGEATATGPGSVAITLSNTAVIGKVLTGLNITGGAILATDNILQAFGKVQNQINGKQNALTLTTSGSSGAATLISDTLNVPNYTLSGLGGVPTTRTLTINGTTQDLSADRTFSVGTVTSVGLSMPAAFSVASSPVTSSGTIAVTAVGLASQYIRGDGQLADFPTGGGGGGSSVSYYLNGSVNQGTFVGNTYYEMNKTPILGAGTDFNIASDGYIAQFITDANDPNSLLIPGGNWNLEFYFSASSGGGTPSFYAELYKYDGTTFTLIADNSANPELIAFGTTVSPYFSPLAVPETVLLATDRLAIRIYVNASGRTITLHTENSNLCQVITTFTTGLQSLNGLTKQTQYLAVGTSGTDFAISSATDTHTFNLPTASATNRGALSSADWTTFNGKQNTITLTTSGSSGASTFISNTLNIPNYTLSGLGGVPSTRTLTINGTAYDLSADRTWSVGTVTSVSALTLGTSGTDLSSTVANGTTTPVITLNVPTASATNRGALSSTDWTTFNSKQDTITLTTTGTSGAATFIANTLNIPQYQSVLTNPVTGTGTSNEITYWTGSSTVGSLSTATYPSLTELSYVKGVTSSIQTQLNAKQGTLTLTTVGTSGAATLIGSTLNIPNYADGGVLSLSAIGSSPNANGGTITGTVLNLEPASASFGGVVTTGTQTFAGDKTFTGNINATPTTGNAIQANTTTSVAIQISSTSGSGVEANATTGSAIRGSTTGTLGTGVYGQASGIGGKGGSFLGLLDAAYAVYAQATGATTVGVYATANSSTSPVLRSIQSGSGSIALFDNSGGTVATITNSGGLTLSGVLTGTTSTFTNSGSGVGVGVTNSGASGDGIKITHSAGRAFNIQSSGAGFGVIINNETASTSAPFTIQKQGSNVITMSDTGAATFSGAINSTITADTIFAATASGTSRKFILLQNTGGYILTGIESASGSALATGGLAYAGIIGTAAATPLQFYTNGIVRQTIASGGNVLIGTITDSGFKLDVNGTGRFSSTISSGGATSATLWSSGITTKGVNGIVTEAAGSSDAAIIRYYNGAAQFLSSYYSGSVYTPLQLVTSDIPRIHITAGGEVYIGDTTSIYSTRLHVKSTVNRVTALTTTQTVGAAVEYFANTSTLVGYLGNGSFLTSGAAATDFILRSENALAFNSNGNNERMRITSAGRVGVGTASPSIYSKLAVAGSIAFTNNTDASVADNSYGNAFAKTSSVIAGGSAVSIKPSLGPEASIIVVCGRSPTGVRFADLVLVIGQAGVTPLVIGSRTYLGPASRTYTNGGESLILQLTGSSETYTVFVTGIGGNEST